MARKRRSQLCSRSVRCAAATGLQVLSTTSLALSSKRSKQRSSKASCRLSCIAIVSAAPSCARSCARAIGPPPRKRTRKVIASSGTGVSSTAAPDGARAPRAGVKATTREAANMAALAAMPQVRKAPAPIISSPRASRARQAPHRARRGPTAQCRRHRPACRGCSRNRTRLQSKLTWSHVTSAGAGPAPVRQSSSGVATSPAAPHFPLSAFVLN